jgi:hypothetical protein
MNPFDDLNTAFLNFEARARENGYTAPACVDLEESGNTLLAWQKQGSVWALRILARDANGLEQTLGVTTASLEKRVRAANMIGELVEEMNKARDGQYQHVIDAAIAIRAAAERLQK